jgi:hypothetical protein
MKTVAADGLIWEDRKVIVHENAELQYFTPLRKEHYHEGMFKFVKRKDI